MELVGDVAVGIGELPVAVRVHRRRVVRDGQVWVGLANGCGEPMKDLRVQRMAPAKIGPPFLTASQAVFGGGKFCARCRGGKRRGRRRSSKRAPVPTR